MRYNKNNRITNRAIEPMHGEIRVLALFYLQGAGMNINDQMKKLQKAILQAGMLVTINRSKFYSAENNRFISVISLTTKVSHYNEHRGEWKEQVYEILRTSS